MNRAARVRGRVLNDTGQLIRQLILDPTTTTKPNRPDAYDVADVGDTTEGD